jgi:hypothetical protein
MGAAPAPRLTEGGDAVKFEWEIVRGAVYRLTDRQRVPLDDAEVTKVITATGSCIICGHGVWAQAAMRRGRETGVLIGPVCAKLFASARCLAQPDRSD